MLNIKLSIFSVFTCLFISYAQRENDKNVYRTYVTEAMPYHVLQVNDSTMTISIPKRHLFPSESGEFRLKTQNDTIYVLEQLIDTSAVEGIVLRNSFIDSFSNSKFFQKSNGELLALKENTSYFKKNTVDSLIGDDPSVFINGELLPKGANLEDEMKRLKKPKRAKLKRLDGQKGYEKYGILGLNGVIEISDKKKRCSKRTQ